MRKLKLQVQMSIDGYIAGPNGEMDWMIPGWDNELLQYVGNLTEGVDCILLGRKLAEGFIPTWKEREQEPSNEDADFIRKMNDLPKIVFSQTLPASPWPNTKIVSGKLKEEINQLKLQDGGDMMVYGGADFVSNLIAENLIDEYYLFINPAAIGRGMPIFNGLQVAQNMELVESLSFACGIALLNYAAKQS